jgi:hypothetical protein
MPNYDFRDVDDVGADDRMMRSTKSLEIGRVNSDEQKKAVYLRVQMECNALPPPTA